MEVKLNGLCGFSNPDYPYVNCCGLLQALVKARRFREKVEVFFGKEGVPQRVQKREEVTGPLRREELQCSRTC